MKHSKLMTAALLGILNVGAMAAQTSPAGAALAPAEKEGCNGKEGCKGKDGCNGKKKEIMNASAAAENKEGCNGKEGCKGKDGCNGKKKEGSIL